MFTYQVKVLREKTYLWGGAGIEKNFEASFYLMCRVDEFGESIELLTESTTSGGQPTRYGTLKPNETYIIPLNNLSGVFAKTAKGNVDSIVECSVISPEIR